MESEKISIFDSSEFSLGREFALLGKKYHSLLVKELEQLDIERHFSIFILLEKMGDNCNQSLLADSIHVNKATMVGILDDLSNKGFIKRIENPSDRREHHIQLSEKGKKYVLKIRIAVNKINDMVMKDVNPYEVDRIQEYLRIMYKNMCEISQFET